MKTKLTPRLSKLIAVAGITLAPAWSLAQTPAPRNTTPEEVLVEEKDLDEPVVLSRFDVSEKKDRGYFAAETLLGTRTREEVIDIPGSIAVINSAMLNDFKIADADQVLKYGVSGVTSNDATAEDRQIRGFRQAAYYRDAVGFGADINTQFYDIDRIEVIKGPAAMVFGDSSILGGAVNYVPRKTTYEPVHFAEVTVGENNLIRGILESSGPIRGDRNARYRVTLGGQNDDREKDAEYNDQIFVGGALDFQFGKTKISLYGFHIDQNSYIYFNDFSDISVTSGTIRLNRYSTESFAPASDENQDLKEGYRELYFTATGVSELTDSLTLRINYIFREHTKDRRLLRGITVEPDNYTLNRQLIAYSNPAKGAELITHVGQLDLLYDLKIANTQSDISAGAEYKHHYDGAAVKLLPALPLDTRNPNYEIDNGFGDPEDLPATYLQNFDRLTEFASYYLQDNTTLFNGKLSLIAGLRWINVDTRFTNRNTSVTTITETPRKKVHRYGIVFKPIEHVSLYYLDADTFEVNSGVNQYNQPWKDSEGIIDEFGIKTFDVPVFGGRLFASAAYFEMAKTNVITVGPFNPDLGVNEFFQTEQDTSKGFEIDFGYAYRLQNSELELKITHYDGETKTANGTRALFAPETASSFLIRYSMLNGTLDGLTLGLGGYFEGNKLLSSGLFMNFADTYDFFASWEMNDKLTFQLNVDNITDERYVASFATPGLVGSNQTRTFRFTTTYHW